MNKIIEKFYHPVQIRWFWPLNTAVLPGGRDEEVIQQMKRYQWAGELSRVYPLSKQNRTANILFSQSGFIPTARYILQLDFRPKVDVIVIRDSTLDYENEQELKDKIDRTIVEDILHVCGASGLFVLDFEYELEEWYNNLLMALAHNENIVEALDHITQQGFFYHHPDLEDKSKLEFFIEKMVRSLDKIRDVQEIPTNTSIFGNTVFSPEDLSRALDDARRDFSFDHESGVGKPMTDLSEDVFKEMSVDDFHAIGDPDSFPEMAIPPSSVPDALDKPGMDGDILGGAEEEMEAEPGDFGGGLDGDSTEGAFAGDEWEMDEVDEELDGDLWEEKVVPRYLQSKVTTGKDANSKRVTKYFGQYQSYYLQVFIGPYDREALQGAKPIGVNELFEDTSEPQDILFVVKINGEEKLSKTVQLPRFGSTPKVPVEFQTGDTGETFEAEIYAYHKNRLLQSALVTGHVVEDPEGRYDLPPLSMDITANPRVVLEDLEDRQTFGSSLLFDPAGEENGNIHAVDEGKSIPLKYTNQIQEVVDRIRRIIEKAVKDPVKYPEDLTHKNNQELLVALAFHGNTLYTDFLHGKGEFKGPIQIVSNKLEFVPFDFVYDYPAPTVDATLCGKAVEGLKEGKCKNCFNRDENPAPHICPFGFWGFSRVIERFRLDSNRGKMDPANDFELISEPTGKRQTLNILSNALYGATKRMEAASPGLLDEVKDRVADTYTNAWFADNWEDWKQQVDSNPDSLVLIVHTEDHDIFQVPQMEIGENQFILRNHISPDIIKGSADAEVPPVVVLIGCETQDTGEFGFDFASRVLNSGASIVISNFTKIRGRQAGPIVMRTLELLKKMKGKEFRIGEVLLKLRQQLLAEGVMVSLALMAQGDADWKIKI